MKSSLLLVTLQPDFAALVRESLDPVRFDVFSTSDFSEAIHFIRKEDCPAVLLDAELDDTSLSVMDIGFALRQTMPEVQFVLIVAAGQEVESASLSPVATLTKPVSMPDLGRLLERITNPASVDPHEASPTPHEPISAQTGDNSTSPLWLTDVSKAAQQLTQLNLESSAQAAFITRNHELWAYAGQLSREAAQELTDSIQRYWDAKGESDLLRFVRLQATEAQHMLYVRKLSDNMTLALVFDAETPFSTIRLQANELINAMSTEKNGPLAVQPILEAAPAEAALEDLDEGEIDIPPISEILMNIPSPDPQSGPATMEPTGLHIEAADKNPDPGQTRVSKPLAEARAFRREASPSVPLNELLMPGQGSEGIGTTAVSRNKKRPQTPVRRPDEDELAETRVSPTTAAERRITLEPISAGLYHLT